MSTMNTTELTAPAVLHAILNRRSAAKLAADRPPREVIEKLLEAAIRAPNHYLNEPWRFFVLTGSARDQLGDVLAERLRAQLTDPASPQSRATLERERKKPLRAPVLIAVAAAHTGNVHALPAEDASATAAAVQNMLLAAPALGLGTFWRTGEAAYDPAVKAFLGLQPEDQIVAFVYVGYPEVLGDVTPRTGLDGKVDWRGWEE